jgi:photosystem II stability/assembly factor-like uncharacterized protein
MKISHLPSVLLLAGQFCAAAPGLIGPFGGSAAVVQVDSRRPGTVLAATSNALLFRSTNRGDSWTHLPFPAELRATLHAFMVTPQTGVYLVGLADETHRYSGIFVSNDAGQSWSRLTELGTRDVWSIAIWPEDPKVMAAGTADGVFLTRDGGEHWARISPESNQALVPVVSLEFDPTDSRIIFAGTPHLPWKTMNGGVTWRPAHTGMTDDSDVFSIHVDAHQPSRVFASACSGIYRSLNQGGSWTKLARAKDASYRTYQITQQPTQSNVLFAGTTHGLERSTDGGTTWRSLSSYATRWIAFDPARPSRLYVATDEAGLFRSDDFGEHLLPINEGFCNRHVDSLAAMGTTLYASSLTNFPGSRIFRTVDLDETWENVDLLAPRRGQQILRVLPIDPTHFYVLATKSILFSPDAGRTWANLPSPATSKLTALLPPTADGRTLLVGTDTGIYRTDDNGRQWLPARTPQGSPAIRSLVRLGPRSNAALTRSDVWISSDGIDYQAVASPAAGSELYGLIATEHADLLAATSYGLRRSEDSGATWQSVHGVLGDSTVSAICKHPTEPAVLFASHYGAIFTSTDDGRTWTPVTSPGEELPAIRELVVAPGIPGSLFAVTRVQGVYAVPLAPKLSWTECRGRKCGLVRIQIP